MDRHTLASMEMTGRHLFPDDLMEEIVNVAAKSSRHPMDVMIEVVMLGLAELYRTEARD